MSRVLAARFGYQEQRVVIVQASRLADTGVGKSEILRLNAEHQPIRETDPGIA